MNFIVKQEELKKINIPTGPIWPVPSIIPISFSDSGSERFRRGPGRRCEIKGSDPIYSDTGRERGAGLGGTPQMECLYAHIGILLPVAGAIQEIL